MATIAEMLRRVQSIKLKEALPDMIKKTSADIILLNQTQLLHGLNANGDKIKPDYKNKYYANKKNARNPNPGLGTPDLRDTGEFYQDFTLEVDTKSLTLSSKNSKTESLISDYGPFIFGLTKDNKGKYVNDTLEPKIHQHITKKTGLEFR